MKIELNYHKGTKTVVIPDTAAVTVLEPRPVNGVASVGQALDQALENPVAGPSLTQILRTATGRPRIAIAVPDDTRPLPVDKILPRLLAHIFKTLPGLTPESVSLVIGGGLHAPDNRAVQKETLSAGAVPGCQVLFHDARNHEMTDFGTTSRGVPVKVNAAVGRADIKIVVGQVDPHQFVGFTGGAKGIAVGCAASETICRNHGLMFEPDARVGVLDGNPVREDLNEAGRMIGIDFAVNGVMTPDKKVAALMAGPPDDVLRQGAKTCASVYGVGIPEPFDMVVASCGGFPKDICLYQAQKGLNQASHALKKGGNLLLLAACSQGVGDDDYFSYVSRFETPETLMDHFTSTGFKMGAHKAYLFGKTLVDYQVALASDLDPRVVRQCQLTPEDPPVILRQWMDLTGDNPSVAVIPHANTTYFYPV